MPMSSVVATRALHVPKPEAAGPLATPTSPDTSLPWSDECGPGGWSAKMFLHQMLSTSLPSWTCSDTRSLLSASTLPTLLLRAGGGSSLSDVLLDTAPTSSELYLTHRAMLGLARRAAMRRRPLRAVSQRTPHGWRQRIIIVSSRGVGYVFSVQKNANPLPGSPEAGLLGWLSDAVAQCAGTPSPCPSSATSVAP